MRRRNIFNNCPYTNRAVSNGERLSSILLRQELAEYLMWSLCLLDCWYCWVEEGLDLIEIAQDNWKPFLSPRWEMVFAITRDVAHFGDMGNLCLHFHLKILRNILLSNERYACAVYLILHKSRLKKYDFMLWYNWSLHTAVLWSDHMCCVVWNIIVVIIFPLLNSNSAPSRIMVGRYTKL